MKKLLSALIICAVITSLQSCGIVVIHHGTETTAAVTDPAATERGGETTAPQTIVVDPETPEKMRNRADELLNGLDTLKISGARLFVAGVDLTFLEGDGELTALTSDRAIRIEKLAEKLDADIAAAQFSENELYDKLKSALDNGEYFADVIAVPRYLAGTLAADGLIKSLRTLPAFDYKAPYFSADSVNAFSAGQRLYAVSGEGCFEPEKIYCVYFNKTLAASLGLDLYGLVSSGEWTLEKFADILNSTSSDTVTEKGLDLQTALYLGAGLDFTENGTDMVPRALTFGSSFENAVRLISAVPSPLPADDPAEKFLEGGALFYVDRVSAAESMSSSDTVWGMLPMPKADRESDYSGYIAPDATVLCVPVCNSDDRLSGDFIEAFFACSTGYIKYDYIYHYMLDVLRDNGSVNCLDIILDGGNCDFVTAMKDGFPTLYANTAGAFGELVSGGLSFEEYKEREDGVAEYLEKWFPVTNK